MNSNFDGRQPSLERTESALGVTRPCSKLYARVLQPMLSTVLADSPISLRDLRSGADVPKIEFMQWSVRSLRRRIRRLRREIRHRQAFVDPSVIYAFVACLVALALAAVTYALLHVG
jgi:hypothetical protein